MRNVAIGRTGAQRRGLPLRVGPLLLALGIALAAMRPDAQALAQCSPASGSATPGTTVTCSGSTTNQNNPNGYGTGTETGITLNVLSGASVTGTNVGIVLGAGNIINNAGAITGQIGIFTGTNSTIVNAGSIIASGGASAGVGIYLNGDGTITSSGPVTATSTSTAVGLAITGNGNITNSGAVTARSAAIAEGLSVSNGNITNSGSVTVTSAVGAEGLVTGNGNITNSGAIIVAGAGPSLGLTVFGNGNISNSAAITITGSGGSAGGISVVGTGNVTNSGAITITNNAGQALGISVSGTGQITNSAAITVIGNPGQTIGIDASGNGSVVANAGSVVASSGSAGGAVAVQLFGNSSTLINSGLLSAGLVNSAAIVLSGTNDTLTLLPGSRIIGPIDLAHAGDTVNITGGRDIAWLWTFNTTGGIAGLAGQTANVTGGAPVVINGNQIATLDPTAFALQDRVLMDFTGAASSVVDSRFLEMGLGSSGSGMSVSYAEDARASAVPFPIKAAPSDYDRSTVVWAKAFGGGRAQDPDGPDLRATNVLWGGALGADWAVNGTLRVGLFGGGGEGHLAVDLNSQTVNTSYGFGGGYGRFDWGMSFLDLKLWGGASQSASTRQVANNLVPGGIENATASYGGAFFTPEIAYGFRVPVGGGVVLTPAARLRYVAGWFDGYTESGSAQALNVGSRTAQDLEERLEVMVSSTSRTPWGQPIDAHATLGAVGIERVGGQTVSGTLIGAPLSFVVPGQSAVGGGYVGTGLDLRINASTSVFTSAEGTVYSDKSRTAVARGGVRVQF